MVPTSSGGLTNIRRGVAHNTVRRVTSMSICKTNHALSIEVGKFINNVGGVNEESITDYLVWKWRELDKRFNYLHVTPFNRREESATTGADFDLELWLVGNTFHVSLAVQAKKFLKQYDSYVTRLRYPNGSKGQLDTLLAYATKAGKEPFYFIYSIPETTTRPLCDGSTSANPQAEMGTIFMVHALEAEHFADGRHGKKVSRDKILSVSTPFHCMFCCPLATSEGKPRKGFASLLSTRSGSDAKLPPYVQRLLDSAGRPESQGLRIEPSERELVERFRTVAAYDMRIGPND